MKVNRREFLKLTATAAGALLIPSDIAMAEGPSFPLHKMVGEAATICPYCSCGCGLLIATGPDGHIINSEGDPDNINNRGALDPKSISVRQLSQSDLRLRKPLYRAPGSDHFEEVEWDWAIDQVAQRIKATRDATFERVNSDGVVVNRTQAIAFLGGAANNDEECYLAAKLTRALGIVNVDHQARLCHSSTVAGLAPSFGRGAMTNHWVDLKNADYILVCGSNCAENHPASMAWIHQAMDERGAKLIVVDPRFTRTASQADVYAPIRSGTDIAFYGGMIKYILDNNLYHYDYVLHYTNAAMLIKPDYQGPDELDGLFSGFVDEDGDGFGKYDRATWAYQTDADGNILRDETLQDPHCVFQILRRHYDRYTLETVSQITGCPKEQLERVYRTYAESGAPDKTGTILYAMGQTQHTVGSQNVRCMAMVQLLLGNIGRPGGGVNALRGESNVQGSTDQGVLAHLVPGYMAIPNAVSHPTFNDYITKETPATSYWSNKPKFFVSLLKAWWGEHAHAANNYAYNYLPKPQSPANHYWISIFEAMYAGTIEGLWIMGQNPAVSGPNNRLEREALKKLKWMVIQELFDTETVSFWRAPDVNPADIQTEVFVLPAADAMEKAGSVVTSGRLIQWREKVAEAPGEALPDHQILNLIALKLKELYAAEADNPIALPILHLTWDYGREMDIEKVAREMNGYYTRDVVDASGAVVGKKGDLLSGFAKLASDGSTACGCWIYSGYFYPTDDGMGRTMPATKRRNSTYDPGGLGIYPKWAFAWPANRRIIYNRCSADPDGNPWSEDKKLIWWDPTADSGTRDASGNPILGKWVGYDVPDFVVTKAPTAAGGRDPFIMQTDGKGRLFAAMNDGPLPEHYEPVESPVQNLLSGQQVNPVIKIWHTDEGQEVGDNWGTPDQFPIVATTFRLVEHWQAGGMSRWLGWLVEAQPEMFIEISRELAAEKGIQNGDRVRIRSARGEIEAVALVTARFKPFQVNGRTVHHVGMPWHWGWKGLTYDRGETTLVQSTANVLTPHVGDANTAIPEYKAFLVDIEKA